MRASRGGHLAGCFAGPSMRGGWPQGPACWFAESWLQAEQAKMQTLDKITARIASVEVVAGQPVRLGTLEIWLDDCRYRPPEEPPEHAAFLRIYDRGYGGDAGGSDGAEAEQIFSGWMFASSPAISAMEHPVYDVTLIACSNTASTDSLLIDPDAGKPAFARRPEGDPESAHLPA